MTTRAAIGWTLVLLSGAGLGCGRDIAQTARRLPPATGTLDCEAPDPVTLPNGAPFGDGREPGSALVGTSYGPENGPGLFVVARDRFRVYMNGELVREGTESRVPEFIPLSVLPGDNVLALVVAAGRGTPAALVQLDELERTHVSDSTWRVSTAPVGDFHAPSYDDSDWPQATDLGAFGTQPGCDPTGVFPNDTSAHWIGTEPGTGSVAVLRQVISIRPVGYGAETTGGLGAEPVLVSTYDELEAAVDDNTPRVVLLNEGAHDFRLTGNEVRDQLVCEIPCEKDPSQIEDTVLTPTETCSQDLVPRSRNERRLSLGSNKTLVGLGRGAALRGVSIEIGASQNVIVRNIAIYDVNAALIEAGDAFGLIGADRVWLDHDTAKWVSDGFTDVTAVTENVTLSWMHYDGDNPDACTGKHPRASQISDSTVTLHHCFFDHVDSHAPFVDHPNARVHVFNDFVSDDPDYGIGAGCGAQVLMEGNVFEAVAAPTLRAGCDDDPSLGLIKAPTGSNLYRDDVGDHRGGDGQEPSDAVFSPPYAYQVDPPQDAWLQVLERAGAGGPWALPLTRN